MGKFFGKKVMEMLIKGNKRAILRAMKGYEKVIKRL